MPVVDLLLLVWWKGSKLLARVPYNRKQLHFISAYKWYRTECSFSWSNNACIGSASWYTYYSSRPNMETGRIRLLMDYRCIELNLIIILAVFISTRTTLKCRIWSERAACCSCSRMSQLTTVPRRSCWCTWRWKIIKVRPSSNQICGGHELVVDPVPWPFQLKWTLSKT